MARVADPGPLTFTMRPRDGATNSLLLKIDGHATSAHWLPKGLWPELDEVRAEHLRVRALLAEDLRELNGLGAKFKAEDERYEKDLKSAYRVGGARPEDERTSAEEREAQRAAIEERVWAGVEVMAEAVERARAVLAAHESEWLADLNHRAIAAQEKVREAERLLEQAKAATWRSVKLGNWMKNEVAGVGFDHQPAPREGEPMPDGYDPNELLKNATQRLYFERDWVRPINQPVPIQTAAVPVHDMDDPLALEDGEEAVIEPLDEADRWAVRP